MWKLLGAVAFVGMLTLWGAGAGASGEYCAECVEHVKQVDSVKWVETCEHAWYVHDIVEPALGKIRAACAAECAAECAQSCSCAFECPDCTCECPESVECTNPPACPDPTQFYNDLAVGLYGMAWDCQGRGLFMHFRTSRSGKGWRAWCGKSDRNPFPVELENIRQVLDELRAQGYPLR